ncbi:MAG: hypothetical protein ACOYO0_06905, partial [Sandarakinorhabdus sp.]
MKVVIGHYDHYLRVAHELDAAAFDVPTDQWNALSDDEKWSLNRQFLDWVMEQSAYIVLATDPAFIKRPSWLDRELRYLALHGYKIEP